MHKHGMRRYADPLVVGASSWCNYHLITSSTTNDFELSKTTVHYLKGQKGMAIESAQKALEIDSRNFQALATIGLLEMEASRYDKAIASFRKCLSLNPWMGNISSLLSLCMSKVGAASNT